MNFPWIMATPLFAVAGLAAVGIAVWAHLYRRTAGKRVAISSLRIAPETPRIARSRRKIQYWPLFLLRALGVLLLGLAFARPGLLNGNPNPERGRETVVFILDRSGSMGLRSAEGSTAWEQVVQQVQSRLSGLHPQSRVRLFCFPAVETGDDWLSPSAMRKRLAGLKPSQAEGRPMEALREAAEALARFRSDMPESLEVIGDLQRMGWEQVDTLTLPGELQVHISQVGDPESVNRGLSLQVRGRDQLRRGAVITRGGRAPLRVRDRVRPNRAGAEADLDEKEIPLPGDVVELPYRAATNGWVRREVVLDHAGDALPDDDTLFDAFFVTPEIPVLLLEPHSEREAFLQTTFFVQQALRPKTGKAAEDSRFLPRTVPVNESVNALRDIAGREAVVVIPALPNWPAELPGALETFLRAGGGAVFFAGPDLQAEVYAEAWHAVLPALPGEVVDLDRRLSLPPVGENHPIWGGLGESPRRKLRKIPLRKRFALTTAAGAEVTARYADQVPLVVVRPVGEGRALFVNTSADRAWGDWPADGALFVPTVHMLVSAVVTSTAQALRNSPGAGIAGVPFDARVDPALAGASLRMGDQPVQADGEGWLRGLRFDQPGLFDIRAEDGSVLRPVAVNFPPEESRREFLFPAVLKRQLEARRRASGEEGETARISMASESGWWRWILAAVVLVWLVEPWLALRPGRMPAEQGAEA